MDEKILYDSENYNVSWAESALTILFKIKSGKAPEGKISEDYKTAMGILQERLESYLLLFGDVYVKLRL